MKIDKAATKFYSGQILLTSAKNAKQKGQHEISITNKENRISALRVAAQKLGDSLLRVLVKRKNRDQRISVLFEVGNQKLEEKLIVTRRTSPEPG